MHSQNGGRCGLCGDNFQAPQPRPHEMGGKFGTGTIVASYVSGSVIRVTATLTTNHKGGFTFELCPLAGPGQAETEECFARYPLELATGGTYYTLPNNERGDFAVDLLLPTGVRCSNCVLRWTYVAANTWGNCGDGTSAAGCGPQETFKNCADISIV
ncbi:hypothetical protein R5R35_000611 [Gryllus longicercus]|uniref:Chitin-binding type-4 domain-containing protein n=1 Tax=Gryllus longicercus TaxID=2509291 RepID=A0AAN9VU88_9ORTH